MGEIVRFRFMDVAGSVKEEKAVGGHWAPRLARRYPDKPSGKGSGFGIRPHKTPVSPQSRDMIGWAPVVVDRSGTAPFLPASGRGG
jgi:hypothetical protein